jgi:putative Mn2+ efflux pump MntP
LQVALSEGQRHHRRCVSPGIFVVAEFQVVPLSPSLQMALAVRIDSHGVGVDFGVIDQALLFR